MRFNRWLSNKFSGLPQFQEFLGKLATKNTIKITGITGSALSVLAAQIKNERESAVFIVCKDDEEAKVVFADLEMLEVDGLVLFPSLDLTPYQLAVVNEDIVSMRLDAVNLFLSGKQPVVVTSVEALLFGFIPEAELRPFYRTITVNETIDQDTLTHQLVEAGYERVKQVTYPGEFAVRGDIVDIYFSSLKNPVRIEFFGDLVEVIKSFHPETQKSSETLSSVTIPPVREILYTKAHIDRALERLSAIGGDEESRLHIEEQIRSFTPFDGEHFYLPLFYEKANILDYAEQPLLLINDIDAVTKKAASFTMEYEQNYAASYNKYRPKFQPSDLLFDLSSLYTKAAVVVEAEYFHKANEDIDVDFNIRGINIYAGAMDIFKADMQNYLASGYKVTIFTVTEAQAGRLSVLFGEFAPENDFSACRDAGFSIVPETLSYGFVSDELKTVFLNDYEIFGKRNKISKHFYTRRTENIDSFIDLKPGDYVVHIHHGIGKFIGIERVKSRDVEKDYLAILYDDDDKVFIPIEQMNFIQKYISGDMDQPRLDRIGGKSWSKTKERVKESVDKLAAELVRLYSFRLHQKGIAFAPDTPWQKEFEAKFPYDETEDQLLTIEEVKRDMESPRPMDRLICGDVGFGKTEVAIRAAFKAVMSGRQVALLVPTTILTEQHFKNISERLSDYPIKVEMLSRFKSAAEQKKSIARLKEGEVDIIVGTHRLLSKDVEYKNLGLLIIDEEHRFGVKHKERIKQIKMNLDSLSMTATPIPRTLHMSLAKIRDMSIINTPPKERLPVETYVMGFNQEILKMGIEQELYRGGQVFFLYNRVKTIHEMQKFIESVVPSARVVVAHGQMEGEELEDIIHDFIDYKYDILLTTTIIESGIDIPRVNTIFIDRADRFGLAQLYQLRGRVGRSSLKAYAYLFFDDTAAVSEDAMKKLRVISEYTELGSGFKIAMKDMEIRGAGNLLGPEQHGDILAVGFSLYCKLLNDAVKELKKKSDTPEMFDEIIEDDDLYLDIRYSGFIPDSYIADPKEKIEMYKKITGVVYEEDLERVKNNMTDRFGKIPPEVERLLFIGEIRIICRRMGIDEIVEKTNMIEIKFSHPDKINVTKLMFLVSGSKGQVFLNGTKPSSIFIKLDEYEEISIDEKGQLIKDVLAKIS